MGFLNKRQEDDDELPGAGLHVDLNLRICPECRTEALPWQDQCAQCGATPVAPQDLPAESFSLPAHLLDDGDDMEPAEQDEEDEGRAGSA